MARLGRTAAIILCAPLACAAWANEAGHIPLSTLNGGPSTEIVPFGPGSRVAFFRWPSEVANPDVVAPNPASPLVDARQVQAGATGGIRWRERSMIPANSDVRPGTNLRVVAANTGFSSGASAARSYIGFLTVSEFNNVPPVVGITGVIDTAAEIETFFTARPGKRVFLSRSEFHGGGFADADLTTAALAIGIEFRVSEIASALPTYSFNQLALVVFKDAAVIAAPLSTEFAEIVSNTRQGLTDAELGADSQTIRLSALRPILDSEPDNPVDGILTPDPADFRMQSGSTRFVSLGAFLAANAPSSGGVSAISIEGDRNEVIRIDLANPISVPSEITAILESNIRMGNNDFSSVVGDNTAYGNYGQKIHRPPCPGDAGADGVVDFLDLNAVLSCFGLPAGPGALGDLNHDGVVDFLDLNIVLGAFGSVC